MEPLQGRRESNYYGEEEEPDESVKQPPPSALPSPPSAACWGTTLQTESREKQHQDSDNADGPSASSVVEKEHMFDKVVTPSDVGKLNRLVIPKQHAEKYFPLDASAGEKGLLLSFEDRTGKNWRFRYSYWNSSQSYVMTKGWSRFVKEKHLDAGDTVSFGRGIGEEDRHRLFIDWKHRPDTLTSHPLLHRLPFPFHGGPSSMMPFPRSAVPWGCVLVPPAVSAVPSMTAAYDHMWYRQNSAAQYPNPCLYLRSTGNPSQVAVQLGIGSSEGDRVLARPMEVFDSMPAVQSDDSTAAKTVRLFGVNLGCSPSEAEPGGDAAANGHAPPAPELPLLPMSLRAPEMAESPGIYQQPASMDSAMWKTRF